MKKLASVLLLLSLAFGSAALAVNIDSVGSAASSVTGTDLFECEQGGVNNHCPASVIAAYVNSLLSTAAHVNTGTSGATIGLLNGNNTESGNNTHTGAETFAEVIGGTRAVTASVDTLASADCGKTITYNNASPITVTIPQGLPIVCVIAIMQLGAGKVSVNGSAVTPATFHTNVAGGTATGTSQQYSTISITNYVTNTVVMAGDGA